MSTEERFNAAANVIRNLPKNGAYQPSEELMLRFYSYYKQATEGPCDCPKPAFWQFVKKARWEAWSGLGNMSKEEAMTHYIEELKGIIETMSYNEDVANFLDRIDLFCDSKLVGNITEDSNSAVEQSNSHSSSSLSDDSAETTLCKDTDNTDIFTSSFETCQESISNNSIDPHILETEPEDEFIDSVEFISDNLQRQYLKNYINENHSRLDYLNNKNKSNLDCEPVNDNNDFNQCNNVSNFVRTLLNHDINKNTDFNSTQLNAEFMNQIMITLRDLQNNLDQVVNRIGNIEKKMQYSSKIQLNVNNEKKHGVVL